MITAIDKNTALVIIDLQKGVAGMQTVHPVKDVIANAVLLIEAFHSEKLPVVIVNVNPMGSPWTKTRKEVSYIPQSSALQTLAKGAMQVSGFDEIVPEIKPWPEFIRITKKNWNAFYDTALHDELQKRKITGIVLAGIATSIGVEGTARAASERAYNLSFAMDAMTDRVLTAHNNSISVIFPRIGEVGTTVEIIEHLKSRQ